MRVSAVVCGAVLLAFTGACSRTEPPSKIVESLRKAGAGDLSSASSVAVESWFRERKQIAVAVEAQCRPIRGNASADWHDSTEGRVCSAARNVAMFVHERRQSSGQKFRGGWN